MRKVTLSVAQMHCTADTNDNGNRAEAAVRHAVTTGANIVLLQELFEDLYFCQEQSHTHLSRAAPADNNPLLDRFSALARELNVVLPVSFFEQATTAYYNSMAMIDADGSILGVYRKSHIPDGPGYQEKFFFNPGDTGFRVWDTAAGRLGVGICWDQWFPESARCMALAGAEMLLYPTAIGSEPQDPGYDSKDHWQNAMRGHAAANLMPVAAANRTGTETIDGKQSLDFYGSSFICDWRGEMLADAGRTDDTVISASFDLDELAQARRSWGIFRDRRPELYGPITAVARNVG